MAASSTKLNPQAPEFFPLNHRLSRHNHQQFQCYSNPFFLPPNPNPSFYYSPSSFTNYFSNSNIPNLIPLVSQNSDLAETQQPLHEASGAEDGASPVSGKSGGGGGGERWNRKVRCSNWRGGSGGFNRREKEKESCLFINDGNKETTNWRVKGDDDASVHYHRNNNWKPRLDYSGAGKIKIKTKNKNKNKNKSFNSIGGSSSRPNFPVLPVESDGQNTTVMIRNIPNRYTRGLLTEFLDEHCKRENEESAKRKEKAVSAFDFLYLPIDFEKKANKGYAFVNFTNPKGVIKFQAAVDNKRWPLFLSNKVCTIAYARVQGKEELVRHFQGSVFDCESDDYLPVSFSPARDGSKSSVEERVIGRRFCK